MIILMRKYVTGGGIYRGLLLCMGITLVGVGIVPGALYVARAVWGEQGLITVNGISVTQQEYNMVQHMYRGLYERMRSIFGDNPEIFSMQGLSGNEDIDARKALVRDLLLTSVAIRLQLPTSAQLMGVFAHDPHWLSQVTGHAVPSGLLDAQGRVRVTDLDSYLRHLGIPHHVLTCRGQRAVQMSFASDAIRLAAPIRAQEVAQEHIRHTVPREYVIREYRGKSLEDIWDEQGHIKNSIKPSAHSTLRLDPRDQASWEKAPEHLPIQKMLRMTKVGQKTYTRKPNKDMVELVVVTLEKLGQAPQGQATASGASSMLNARKGVAQEEENLLFTGILEALRTHATIKN